MIGNGSSTEFLLAEYNGLREEIKWIISRIEAIDNLALITSGAFWAWLITQNWKPEFIVGLWLPFVITFIFSLKRQGLSASLKEVAEYVFKLEIHFCIPEGLGWEHYLKSTNPKHFKKWRNYYWSFLFVVNILIAILLICDK